VHKRIIPVNTPLLNGNEEKYLLQCIRTGWISSEGPFVEQFETKFSTYIGRKEGIAVANGSGALDIAVQALDIGTGDEVIMPTFTIISPALSIIRAGAKPILIDSNPVTWNMDVTQIEAKITSKTKAILVVHIYGLPVEMDPVIELSKKYGLFVIEDSAEMHGQTYKGKKCGTFGDISTFSFYPNKHITTGEGGMILVDDQKLAERCRKLRNLAFENVGRRFMHKELGWNYRMTNLQAAIGVAQLEKIDEHLIKKRKIGNIYQNGLKDLKGFQLPLGKTEYSENIYWVFGMVAKTNALFKKTLTILNDSGIATRPFFWCMHEQPAFNSLGLFKYEKYPIAENLARKGFYLPSGLGLTITDLRYILKVIQ